MAGGIVMLDFDSEKFRDQIMGCWMGKNCGGTLGAPLEKAYAELEPFDIDWYPKLEPGGMPNDDLEMQLVWLKALEEIGPDLTEREMAQYWIDYIGYNWDEYGLSKTNLRLGLRPPVSGAYNNWFVDCMGCPIRSEIWAAVTPGAPRVAMKYAYADAVCDHAGGESVWGEFFNTAIESAAFIESDINTLLDIGRSYVPDKTKTAKAIDTAREAHKKGMSWQEARKAVMKATPSMIAQYSPINMGIQVIGLLYGKGFADTLCLTVNCGYDTDCTGATVGSILGIISGYSNMPEKWTKPLGEKISTNASWGGIKNVLNCENPIPADLDELTDRTIAVCKKVMNGVEIDKKNLYANESVFELAKQKPMSIFFTSPEQPVTVDYGKDPVISPKEEKKITTIISNPHPEKRTLSCRLYAPDGWNISPAVQDITVQPGKGKKLSWMIKAKAETIQNSNRLTLFLESDRMPSPDAVPVVLIGGRALQVSGPYIADRNNPLDTKCAPEKKKNGKRGGKWAVVYGRENKLPREAFPGPGIMYVRGFLKVKDPVKFSVVVQSEAPFRYWVDGKFQDERLEKGIIRPAGYRGKECKVFKKGMHEILIKILVPKGKKPETHVILTKENKMNDGLIEAEWTQLQ